MLIFVFGSVPSEDAPSVGVNDKLGSPTYALDFVRGARFIAELGFYGTYHLVNHGGGRHPRRGGGVWRQHDR